MFSFCYYCVLLYYILLFFLCCVQFECIFTTLSIQYNDVIMSAMASQVTSLTIVYSTVYSGTNERKNQSSASLAFVWGIHRWPVNSPHKGPVTRKMFPFDDVIMLSFRASLSCIIIVSITCVRHIANKLSKPPSIRFTVSRYILIRLSKNQTRSLLPLGNKTPR